MAVSLGSRIMSPLLVLLALSSFSGHAHGYLEQKPLMQNDVLPRLNRNDRTPLPYREINTSPRPSTILFEVGAEVRGTNKPDYADAWIRIDAEADTAKLATDHVQQRLLDIEDLLWELGDNPPTITHDDGMSWRDRVLSDGTPLRDFLPSDDTSIKEGQPVHAAMRVEIKAIELPTLHRFVFAIKDDADLSMSALLWRLSQHTRKEVLKELRAEVMDELQRNAEDYADEIGFDILYMQDYSDGPNEESQYFFGGINREKFNFQNWDSIREYFAEDPETSGTRIGEVYTDLRAQCKFRAVKGKVPKEAV